jgi:arginyl-tRNA--protein-N-Asp/Glu arginylyltransferase
MFVHAESPSSMLPEELDTYLANGWFRMAQTIFTTQFLCFKDQLYNAVWLRIDLQKWKHDSLQQKLVKRNQHFRTEITKATYSDAHHQLFQTYKEGVAFEGSASLHQLLFAQSTHNIYNTFEVNVYDKERLIACGIFDLGKESAQGITCFYNHDYKKYSLGKFLIYLKIMHCQEHGMRYFYPGYFVPGYKPFDYKLNIGKGAQEYWHFTNQTWEPLKEWQQNALPLGVLTEKLTVLQQLFKEDGRDTFLMRYEFFDANLVPHLQGTYLFDYPVFLYVFDLLEDLVYPVIVFDLVENCYQLVQLRSVWVSNAPPPTSNTNVYSSHLLKADKVIFSSPDPAEMVRLLQVMRVSVGEL